MALQSQSESLGQITPVIGSSDYNSIHFVITQLINKIQTATIVKVVACTNTGGVSPVGYVDVVPLVAQIDAQGVATPHSVIHGLPYFRIQGGQNAIIIDPQVGDLGICVFASRDISGVKTTKKESVPGTFRRYSFSDGMYLGGLLNGTPSQYVQFNSGGISIVSPSSVAIQAPTVAIQAQSVTINASSSATINTPTLQINGNVVMNGSISQVGGGNTAAFSGDVSVAGDVQADGISLTQHVHTAQGAFDDTTPPLP